MIEEILCVARLRLSREQSMRAYYAEAKQSKALAEGLRRQIRSIVSLCEEFGDRSKVQNLPIRTIFTSMLVCGQLR